MPLIQGKADMLKVQNLTVRFGANEVVKQVSFEIARGEKFALVGESGSGKTQTALSLLRLNTDAKVEGSALLNDKDLLKLSERELRGIRGNRVAMIFQEPMTALNPLYSVGNQICEVLETHQGLSRAEASKQAIEWLAKTQIPEPEVRFHSLPHQLSGGQRQRAMIAMALACKPDLLIADEPTTALDVTVQEEIIELLNDLQRELGMAILLITHDLPLVKRFAHRVGVMQNGELLEQGPSMEVFSAPKHAYTQRLIASRPRRLIEPTQDVTPVLEGKQMRVDFISRQGWFGKRVFTAVENVSLRLNKGSTLGIVGESGSGKTTLGMSLLRLSAGKASGEVLLKNSRIDQLSEAQLRPQRKFMQVVFQDPYNSLSPRRTIEQIVGEGLALHQPTLSETQVRQAVADIMVEVGLKPEMMQRYPHEFSGGQRQRISIARALIVKPELMLLDEPTSALDVSVQSQVLELLVDLQKRYGLSYLFITHDLAVIRAMAHEVIVMKGGKVIEVGETLRLFANPQSDYAKTLLKTAALDDVHA